MAGEEKQAGENTARASELIRAGKYRDALAVCIQKHGATLGRYCMAMLGEPREAEEAVQQTLGMAYDAMPYWEGDTKVRTWLFSLARRICTRRVEARRSVPPPFDDEPDASEAPLSDEQRRKRERAREVRGVLSKLSPFERDVIILRYQSGLAWSEIAYVCAMEDSEIRVHASRALLRLREFFKSQGSG